MVSVNFILLLLMMSFEMNWMLIEAGNGMKIGTREMCKCLSFCLAKVLLADKGSAQD
jgi:hypothetical protein